MKLSTDNKIHIAIIDDDNAVLHNVSALLKDFDQVADIDTHSNIEEAVVRFSVDPPQILLLDLHLTDSYGLDRIHHLLAAAPAMKIIIYSNYYSPEKALEAKRAGAKGYVVKNVQIDLLYRAILEVNCDREVWPEELPNGIQSAPVKKYTGLLKILKYFTVR